MVKRGIWKEREYVPTSEDIFMNQQEAVEKYDQWKDMSHKQLEEAVEDDLDFEDDDYMKELRAKRLGELQEKAKQHKFPHGMIEISK